MVNRVKRGEMMAAFSSWSIPGSDGEEILGNAHAPSGEPRGIAIIAHGFKGYKDYGFLPRLAETIAAAGFIAHRFNFSHSGMTNEIATFARPDLFERDTWNRQVLDLRAVIEAVADRRLTGAGLPYVLFGHSRGGVVTLLTSGRYADDQAFPQPAGVIAAAAPATCNPLSSEEASRIVAEGYIESPSSRTGQRLRVGRAFLQEQLDDPAGHDLPALVRRIRCPILIVHGEEDATVPVEHASMIAKSARFPQLVVVPGGDHVFNTPNPLLKETASSPQLSSLLASSVEFVERVCDSAR